MQEIKLIIPGRFPSLNEYINRCRHNKFAGAGFKKKVDRLVQGYILEAKLNNKMFNKVLLRFEWHEKDRRRDLDNVMSAKKYILDAMVKARVIPDDSQKYVKEVVDKVLVDPGNPRVEVYIQVLIDSEKSLFEG